MARKIQAELNELNNWEVKTADLEQEEKLLREIGRVGRAERRRRRAGEICAAGRAQLADLKMMTLGLAWPWSRRMPTAPGWPMGAARASTRRALITEFLISANPGEPLKPMGAPPGGETARLMLALKSTLAHADAHRRSFDEIDQGIGGRAARSSAESPGGSPGRWPGSENGSVPATPGALHHPSAHWPRFGDQHLQ